MPSRKSKKTKIFSYDELMARKKVPSKPFLMLLDDYNKLKERGDKLESLDVSKLPKGFNLRKEKLKINTMFKYAKVMRGDSTALYEIIKSHQRSKQK